MEIAIGRDLEVRREEAEEGVAEFDGEGAGVDFGEGELAGFGEAGVEDLVEVKGEAGVVGFDAEFEVEAKTAGVPVCGADQRPGVVDEEEFGVIEGTGIDEDAAAAFEGLPELAEGGPVDVEEVGFFGEEDVDLDAAEGGGV